MNVNKVAMQASWGQMAAEDSPRTGGGGKREEEEGDGHGASLRAQWRPRVSRRQPLVYGGGWTTVAVKGGHAVAAMLDAGLDEM